MKSEYKQGAIHFHVSSRECRPLAFLLGDLMVVKILGVSTAFQK